MIMLASIFSQLRRLVLIVTLLPVVVCSTSLTDKLKALCREHGHPVIKFDRSTASGNCSGDVPFSEADFHSCLPPPPCFTIPPPPPFISADCSATYSWELVRNEIPKIDDKKGEECTKREDVIPTKPKTKATTPITPSTVTTQPRRTTQPKRTRHPKDKDRKKENEASKRNKARGTDEFLADVTSEEDPTLCTRACKPDKKIERRIRGVPGPPGPPGPQGPSGAKGLDGLSGLVVFPDAASMFGVSVEGLIAYRTDVKRLFVRDHLTWRPIRVAKCGDGIIDRDLGEYCDDGNEDIYDDCLGCRRSTCGDGVRNRRIEECDGRDFGDKSCATYRDGMTGTLTCTPDCQISYQRCRHKRDLRR